MPVTNEVEKQQTAVGDYGLVSIIMPCYNSEKYIEATVKSVLAQTYQNWELLLVDDSSSDASIELVKAFGDERIRIFALDKNGGAALARNKAIEEARGRWIAFLDSDDLWMPEKLERQIAYMCDGNIAFSYTDYEVIDDEDELIATFRPKLSVCKYTDILKHNHIGCLTVIYDADKLGKVFMPTEAIKREDVACWLSILKTGEAAYCLHECLAKYKVHSCSVSSNKLQMIKYQWQVYRQVERINPFKSAFYLVCWAIMGFFKYR